MPRICVVGSSNIDLTFRTARLPRPGETLTGQAFTFGFGGKGANQAVMAARLGAQVSMVSRVGGDVFGEQTLRNYQDQGVDITHVRVDSQQPTGVASIVVDDQAQNCILVIPGANGVLSPSDVRAAATAIGGADVLLCQLEVPLETTLEAFRIARAAGVRTLLNPAPAVPLPEELLRLTDQCVPNETEAELLTGQSVSTLEQAAAAARSLLQRGPQAIVVTLGDKGALIVNAHSSEHIPAVPVNAIDTTGAGDVFIGSLAVLLAEGRPLPEAVRWANAVAALSVRHLGTQTAFPSRAEVEGFAAGKN
jgi:ribokinase